MSRRTILEVDSDTGYGQPADSLPGIREEVRYTTIRTVEITKQGVRNLNGPRADGSGHNGKRASCPHFRAPGIVPTYKAPELVTRPNAAGDERVVSVMASYCSGCGMRLYDSGED